MCSRVIFFSRSADVALFREHIFSLDLCHSSSATTERLENLARLSSRRSLPKTKTRMDSLFTEP